MPRFLPRFLSQSQNLITNMRVHWQFKLNRGADSEIYFSLYQARNSCGFYSALNSETNISGFFSDQSEICYRDY
jgi:hypothetical protein